METGQLAREVIHDLPLHSLLSRVVWSAIDYMLDTREGNRIDRVVEMLQNTNIRHTCCPKLDLF